MFKVQTYSMLLKKEIMIKKHSSKFVKKVAPMWMIDELIIKNKRSSLYLHAQENV